MCISSGEGEGEVEGDHNRLDVRDRDRDSDDRDCKDDCECVRRVTDTSLDWKRNGPERPKNSNTYQKNSNYKGKKTNGIIIQLHRNSNFFKKKFT
jgi:hypothetical protein